MRELPIIMTGPSIPAIQDGTKTVTRRVIKPQPGPNHYRGRPLCRKDGTWRLLLANRGPMIGQPVELGRCPYGVPGDLLFVKEAWAVSAAYDSYSPSELTRHVGEVGYRAGGGFEWGDERGRWRASIHMPKWASRLWLLNEGDRIERVQEISEADAFAEGTGAWGREHPEVLAGYSEDGCFMRDVFRDLWDSIHAKPKPVHATVDGKRVVTHYVSYPWEAINETREHRGKPWHVFGNPYVWAVTFKRTEKPNG